MPKVTTPTVTNQVDVKFMTEREQESHTFVPASGVYFVQPLNIILHTPIEIDLRIAEELKYFTKFNWIRNNVYNLHLPILQIAGFKDADAIYKVVLGHNIVATAIHLKIPLINTQNNKKENPKRNFFENAIVPDSVKEVITKPSKNKLNTPEKIQQVINAVKNDNGIFTILNVKKHLGALNFGKTAANAKLVIDTYNQMEKEND